MSRNILGVSVLLVFAGSLVTFAQTEFDQNQFAQSQAGKPDQNNSQVDRTGRTDTPQDLQNQTARNQARNQAGKNQAGKNQDGQVEPWKNADRWLASCIALGNQEAIALAARGKQQAHSSEVKMFADRLVKDHLQFLTKLEAFAPDYAQSGLLDSGSQEGRSAANTSAVRSESTATNENAKSTAGDTASRKPAAGDSYQNESKHSLAQALIQRELAQQCLASAQEKLNEKSGAEFDKCFIGQQITKQMAMKDKLQVYQRHASADLAAIFEAGQRTTEEHLEKAESLMKSLERGNVNSRAQSTESSTQN